MYLFIICINFIISFSMILGHRKAYLLTSSERKTIIFSRAKMATIIGRGGRTVCSSDFVGFIVCLYLRYDSIIRLCILKFSSFLISFICLLSLRKKFKGKIWYSGDEWPWSASLYTFHLLVLWLLIWSYMVHARVPSCQRTKLQDYER